MSKGKRKHNLKRGRTKLRYDIDIGIISQKLKLTMINKLRNLDEKTDTR